mgnify:CR=1 FL=1
MSIPEHMLPQLITKVRPAAGTDTYGNTTLDYGVAATRTANVKAWLQQDKRAEPRADGRDPLMQWWLLITNDADMQGRDRIEFGALTFEIEGPPELVYTPAGFHHTEVTLKAVGG